MVGLLIPNFIWWTAGVLVVAWIVFSVVIYLSASRYPNIVRYESEDFFKSSSDSSIRKPFPSISDVATVTLSVIVPAYNEEDRLGPMLDDCLEYLHEKSMKDPNFSYEVIVVDDGSRDRTTSVALDYAARYGDERFRVLTLVNNRGKGGAVRLGMLSGRGEFLLFADADGATTFSDYDKLEECMKTICTKNKYAVVIGSRAHLEKESISQRSFVRTILMYGFHFMVWLFAVRGIRDTQCGFKLFTRDAALVLFTALHVQRWAFDVEMLYIAQKLNFSISEVAVRWKEVDGSKITPFLSWLEMGRDLILIWYRYFIGAWAIPHSSAETSLLRASANKLKVS